MAEISAILLKQRIRNSIIDLFDWGSSYCDIAKLGTFEFLELWMDITHNGWDPKFFDNPVFSNSEQEVIEAFHSILDQTVDTTPTNLFSVEKIKASGDWAKLVSASKSNFALFMKRGCFSDENEVF